MAQSLDSRSLFGHLEREAPGFDTFENDFFTYLLEFCESIMRLRFADQPDYNALRHLLDSARLSYLKMKNISVADTSRVSNCFTNITVSSASCPTTPSDTDQAFTSQATPKSPNHTATQPKKVQTPEKDINLSYYSYAESENYLTGLERSEIMTPKMEQVEIPDGIEVPAGINRQITAFSWKNEVTRQLRLRSMASKNVQ